MTNLDLLKNPIVLGVLASIITYLYMYWQENQRHKKNPKSVKKSINIMTPGVVGALVWFASGSYFDKTLSNIPLKPTNQMIPNNTIIERLDDNVPIGSDSPSGDSKSYRLVGKGKIQLPQQDVFLDLANW